MLYVHTKDSTCRVCYYVNGYYFYSVNKKSEKISSTSGSEND